MFKKIVFIFIIVTISALLTVGGVVGVAHYLNRP